MGAAFDEVRSRAQTDPVFFASLVLNPERTLQEANINVEDPADVAKVELVVRSAQENLKSAARVFDLEIGTASWGIGAGCCNGARLLPGAIEEQRGASPTKGSRRFERPIGPGE